MSDHRPEVKPEGALLESTFLEFSAPRTVDFATIGWQKTQG